MLFISSNYNWEEGPFQLFLGLFRGPPTPTNRTTKVSSSARAVALWKIKGRLLIVAIAAFRAVTAVDVAALVSNMALAEKEILLSGIGRGPAGDYDLL